MITINNSKIKYGPAIEGPSRSLKENVPEETRLWNILVSDQMTTVLTVPQGPEITLAEQRTLVVERRLARVLEPVLSTKPTPGWGRSEGQGQSAEARTE